MARAVAAYLFVRRGRDAAARIARFDGDNAGCLLHVVFHTPETPSGENSRFVAVCGFGPCLRNEFQRYGIDAVAGVLRGESFAGKDVAEMASAGRTDDFGTDAVGIGPADDRTRYRIVETWPAASGIELVCRPVERSSALTADVCTGLPVVPVFAAERHLRSLVYDDMPFRFAQFSLFMVSVEFQCKLINLFFERSI